jgi:hypothetical protein
MAILGWRWHPMRLLGLLLAAPTAWSSAAYAQDATRQPGSVGTAASSAETDENEVPIHFVSDQPDLKLLIGVEDEFGHKHFADVCTAPCDATLARDKYRMALSPPGGDAVESGNRITLLGPSIVKGHYESHTILSVVLLLSELVVASVGIALYLEATADRGIVCDNPPPNLTDFVTVQTCHQKGPDTGLLAAAELVAGLGTGIGIAWFLLHDDKARIEVVPSSGLSLLKRTPVERGRMPDVPEGMVLRMMF